MYGRRVGHSLSSKKKVLLSQTLPKIKLKQEISVITVRYQNGIMYSYVPIDNAHKNQILNRSISPAIVHETIKQNIMEKNWWI